MCALEMLKPTEVFKYFEQICAIPHGSGNMGAISEFCLNFASTHGLRALRDEAENVIIYKEASLGYEEAEPIILQAHLDMVCQKTMESAIDFDKDGIELCVENGYVKAKDTTLGADNGIAVAMIMAILADNDLKHPPIEAVFTTDEEVGMIGAGRLDFSLLRGARMINLDAEESELVTVSCAGGSDVKISFPAKRTVHKGTSVKIEISGLRGGHSGVEIDKHRVNANILMGRILEFASKKLPIKIRDVKGGNKLNAIPLYCTADVVTDDAESLCRLLEECFGVINKEIRDREPKCSLKAEAKESGEFEVLNDELQHRLIYMLIITPNGIEEMSAEIEGLVETSLNLGVLCIDKDEISMRYALRSNKKSSLNFLEDRLIAFAKYNGCKVEISGRYEPWEFKPSSPLRDLYIGAYSNRVGVEPQIAAIHAGLECAVFSGKIDELDCIAIGPDVYDAHTTEEKLSASSVKRIYEILCDTLDRCR